MSKNAPWCLSPQNPCARTSNLAPSSVFVVLCWNCSPESVWRSGSTATLWQTSARRLAVMSLTSLCLSEGNPPCAQLKACSTVKCFPQTQILGRWVTAHGYGRSTLTATGVLRLRLWAYYAYGYGRATLMVMGVLGLRLWVYYAYGYGRIAATTTGVLQAYYGLAAGCKLTPGHYNCER